MTRRALARAWGVAVLTVAALAPVSSRGAGSGAEFPEAVGQSRDPQMAGAPVQGTGTIAGTVIAADTGRPVRRARVSLSAVQPRFSKSVTTDDQGRFAFTDLLAGEYDLMSTKLGFLDMTYGQRRPGPGQSGIAIRIVERQRIENLKLALPRGGVLTGTVVDDLGDPAYGTEVRALRYVMRTGERTLQSLGIGQADDRGIYRIAGLPPGEYIVMATPRADASEAARMEETMMRFESVAAANRAAGANGDAAMAQAKIAAQMEATKVSLAGAVSGDTGPASGYAPVYFPGTPVASSATSVTLGPSEERGAVNMQLPLVPLARVTGTISGTQGLPAGAVVQLVDTSHALPGFAVRNTRVGVDGKFAFNGVAPGQYTINARMDYRAPADKDASLRLEMKLELKKAEGGPVPMPAAPLETFWATSALSVDGRLVNIDLPLRAAMSASGTVTFDGVAPRPPDLTRVRVALLPTGALIPGESPAFAADASGRFKVTGLVPGRYRVQVLGATGWRLASAMANGQDALDTLLEIKPGEDVGLVTLTFTDKSTTLSGVVTDAAGRPATDYTIVAFSAEQRFWTSPSRRILSTRPASDGKYTFKDLPAGDYRLAAVIDAEPGQWYDPAFLRQLIGTSLQFSLNLGETKTQDLRVK